MSTDETREPQPAEPWWGGCHGRTRPGVPSADDDRPASDAAAAISDIESTPLAERAPGYQDLADRLRVELEQSDPSRGPN